MPRKKISRRIQVPPVIKGMSVYGVKNRKLNEIILHLEEYEAIRLLDYENLNQIEAAVYMDISRPTLTRIYETARNKVATAFVEGRDILIKGGDIYFEKNWYKCNNCKASFNTYNNDKAEHCPICNSTDTMTLNAYYS